MKAHAHKEADLIKAEARIAAEREIATLAERIDEARREAQRHTDTAEKAKSELRSLLMSHLSLIERATPAPAAAATETAAVPSQPILIVAEVDETDELPINGKTTHRIVE